jgi:chromatin-remodeling ATPase INO80
MYINLDRLQSDNRQVVLRNIWSDFSLSLTHQRRRMAEININFCLAGQHIMEGGGGTEDSAASILTYRIRLHKELRKKETMCLERRVRQRYESARKCLRIMGLDPGILPQPQMGGLLTRAGQMVGSIKDIEAENKGEPTKSVREEIDRAYAEICRKGVPKVYKLFLSVLSAKMSIHKKISTVCQREIKRALMKTSKTNPQLKGKRITRELSLFYKRSERSEREEKRRAEKEDYERRRREEEIRESEKQAKKLDFLITQTELFSHFVLGKKDKQEAEKSYCRGAIERASEAAKKQKEQIAEFDQASAQAEKGEKHPLYNNSVCPISQDLRVPSILQCTLKGYQKRGLEWLVSLYNQGINGMLADEMGLGKTVQAISFLAHLAERENSWGPFLVITPASTLHNWEQEFAKFLPPFRVVSYWGSIQDRKNLRKNWQQRKLHRRDSPFHVVITSYQLAVTDEKYFSRLKWQYMVLDEAQAIKSSSSARWKSLLGFKARNRLLLTGTPIQNTLHELWALLHFIMPALFDSHGEFSEWFKIEDGNSGSEAARLKMILQPFMLRREKKDVANELGEKIEKTIFCELSPRQKRLYEGIRTKAPMASLLEKISFEEIEGVEGLMNLVMQFRKVCNHPDLFERREASAGWIVSESETYLPEIIVDEFMGRKRLVPGLECEFLKGSRCWKKFLLESLQKNRYSVKKKPLLRVEREAAHTLRFQELQRLFVPKCVLRRRVVRTRRGDVPEALGRDELAVSDKRGWGIDSALRAHIRVLHLPWPRYEFVTVPSMERFISDSGKLAVLDSLLPRLKAEGHRVLIYFQMTRMIDLFEDYLTVQKHSYLRLDGSSRISNRKDIVKDWQSNSNKFIFLLSTRAGGLGINLTAADTVIFYDSDWNPTADQQAMDRAHRLGQTKQVTVYRLVTEGTIEERVMERAGIKGEMQRRVIHTGSGQ